MLPGFQGYMFDGIANDKIMELSTEQVRHSYWWYLSSKDDSYCEGRKLESFIYSHWSALSCCSQLYLFENLSLQHLVQKLKYIFIRFLVLMLLFDSHESCRLLTNTDLFANWYLVLSSLSHEIIPFVLFTLALQSLFAIKRRSVCNQAVRTYRRLTHLHYFVLHCSLKKNFPIQPSQMLNILQQIT